MIPYVLLASTVILVPAGGEGCSPTTSFLLTCSMVSLFSLLASLDTGILGGTPVGGLEGRHVIRFLYKSAV